MSSPINANIERIQDNDIDLPSLLAMEHFPACGGLALFAGTVRDHHEGRDVSSLKYTSYKPLAEKMIRQIEKDIEEKHQVEYVRVVHRVGHLNIGEVAIYAVARAGHRREAFAACEEAVERVKHEVPVWKEEFYTDGTSVFVDGCCIRTDFDHKHDHKHHLAHHQHDHKHHHGEHCRHEHG
jgi:molybdopterin synthase catalytic subunit